MHHRREIRRAGRPGAARRLRAGQRQRQGLAAFVALAAALVLGCGGSGGIPGVDGSKSLAELNPTEKAALCDYIYGKTGGYHNHVVCDGEDVEVADTDQATCVSTIGDCDVPVSALANCLVATWGSIARCDIEAYMDAQMSSDCRTFGHACLGWTN